MGHGCTCNLRPGSWLRACLSIRQESVAKSINTARRYDSLSSVPSVRACPHLTQQITLIRRTAITLALADATVTTSGCLHIAAGAGAGYAVAYDKRGTYAPIAGTVNACSFLGTGAP